VAKRVAIVQSSYIPWKGYFDLIASVDEFILYDDAQYTKRDWRNRNRIKTRSGLQWLTVPVVVTGRFEQRVRDTVVADQRWRQQHWRSIQANYARAPHFERDKDALEGLFLGFGDDRLSAINHRFLTGLCAMIGIRTRLSWSMDYTLEGERTARLVGICKQAGASEYLTGPSARGYLDEAQFQTAGIVLRYADYNGYREYPQLYPPFEHQVSAIDLLVHVGPHARKYLRGQ
jgi:WbqC-like protein